MCCTLAKWEIERAAHRGNGALKLYYHNLQSGQRFLLGEHASDVPDDMAVEWVVRFGEPAMGDLIVLSDGNELIITPHGLKVHQDTVKLDDGTMFNLGRRAAA